MLPTFAPSVKLGRYLMASAQTLADSEIHLRRAGIVLDHDGQTRLTRIVLDLFDASTAVLDMEA